MRWRRSGGSTSSRSHPPRHPPVVNFLDYGQYKYELTKREKEAKRKQRAVEFKEVRLTPKIGLGDFETKVHRAIEFLEDGDRIKVTVRFRGRELTHPEIGRNLLAKFGDAVKDHGIVDRAPALEGKSMFMTLASVHKPRVHEHRIQARPDGRSRRPRTHGGAGDRSHAPSPSPSPPQWRRAETAATAPQPEPEPAAVAAEPEIAPTAPQPAPAAARPSRPQSPRRHPSPKPRQ